MPRLIKRPEERRKELLDCALRLFFERGYEATSIHDIASSVGISKGAFYHHFASKEAMLEALAERFADELMVAAKGVLEDPTLNAYERLVGYLAQARRSKLELAPMVWATFAPIFKPENLQLYYRINMAVRTIMTPVFTRIIEEGIAERSFDTPDAKGAAEIILMLGSGIYDAMQAIIAADCETDLARAIAALEQRLQVLGIAADRLLGLPDGSIKFAEPGYTASVLAARKQAGVLNSGRRLAS
jgi:AcrR family transcriptional regulator